MKVPKRKILRLKRISLPFFGLPHGLITSPVTIFLYAFFARSTLRKTKVPSDSTVPTDFHAPTSEGYASASPFNSKAGTKEILYAEIICLPATEDESTVDSLVITTPKFCRMGLWNKAGS